MSEKNSNARTISIIGLTNFLCSLNPAFFCTFTALMIFHGNSIFGRQALDVLFVFALYASPLLFTGIPEHYLTTRYSCRNVITFSRVFEIGICLAASLLQTFYSPSSRLPFLIVVVLLGVVYAMYRPAMKGYTAEKVSRPLLSWASAVTESTTFFGIVAGSVLAVISSNVHLSYGAAYGGFVPLAGLFSAFIAMDSLVLATRLWPDLAQKHNLRFAELPRQWLDTLRKQPHYRELLLTGIGESYIFGVMIFVASMIVQYASVYLKMVSSSHVYVYVLMPSAVLGCGFGCLIGGGLSRKNVELGLAPPSVCAMTLISLLVGSLPYYADFYIESGLLAGLIFVFGIFSGMMLVPMQAYQIYFVKKTLRPAFFAWFYLPFGLGILSAIALSCFMYFCKFEIYAATLLIALLTACLAVITFAVMPQFLLRMLMKLLLSTLYRLRIFHAERLPEEGPALIVANRASFVDIFFISACTTRPIRFMMHESFFRNRFMRPLYAAAGFLEVTPAKPRRLRRLLEETHSLLAKGELVCVFPEGDITHNGTMSAFKDGVSILLPEDVQVPVIPLRIGMTWGSIFSCFEGKFKLHWPNELPHPASVTIGKPVPPDISAYELRIVLTELAAETEMIPGPQERPFHSQFAFIARRFPFRTAVREYTPSGSLAPFNVTLLIRAILLSRYLRRIQDDDEPEYVGMMLPNGVSAFVTLMGILMADHCPAILNYTASSEAQEHAIKKTGVRRIITSREFIAKLGLEPRREMVFAEDIIKQETTLFRKLFWGMLSVLLSPGELMRLVSPGTWNDTDRKAVVLFSSGSTGLPKGIMLSHHNIAADVSSVIKVIGWRKSDRILGNLPVFHSFGLNVCLWMPVVTGGETVFVGNPLDAVTVRRALAGRKITVLMSTPAFLQAYMHHAVPDAFKSLRLVVTAAEKLRDDIADKFFKLTGLAIAEGYGCTELSPIVSINVANSIMELGTTVAKRGSIGPPIAGVCVKIVDPDTFRLQPENTDGLLIVKGANVMMGYLDEPEKTAEVIRDGWYVTGDIARMDKNGFITLSGRVSRFSKIAGEMVPHELVEREINNILLPDKRIVAVCGAEDPRRGEVLIVFYTDENLIRPHELVRALRAKGIPNLWIPKAENFIRVDVLPLLGSGKLDLVRMKQMAKELYRPFSLYDGK